MTGPSGRWWERGSPSKEINPLASAARGGRNLITVPAFPTSIPAGPIKGAGVILQRSSSISIFTPRLDSALIIKSVSLERKPLLKVDGDEASALNTRARFVTDFDPGIFMAPEIGFDALKGALHILESLVHRLKY
jgi:hypothetical protein